MTKMRKQESKVTQHQEFAELLHLVPNPVSATKKTVNANKTSIYGLCRKDSWDTNGTQHENSGIYFETATLKKKMSFNSTLVVNSLRAYTPAKLSTSKTNWFIYFHAFDPSSGKMKRKRIRINYIESKRERKVYANDLIARINAELINGWNPWVNNTSENTYATIEIAADAYRKTLERLCTDDFIRIKTLKGNLSMLNVLMEYNKSTKNPKKYIYQFNGEFLSEFLDYIWLEKGNSGTTRDNYINWLRSFAKFLLSKQFIEIDPTSALLSLGKKKSKKERLVISPEHMAKLKDYCEQNNKHYLLAAYILYYCFIRPKEMSHIKLEHISIKNGTIFIPDKNSKNRKDGTVTLPDKVIKLMIELDIFKHPSDYYLFGKYFKPNKEWHSDKQIRDFWAQKIRVQLKFPKEYKFYSLKDTGITDLIKVGKDLLSVRDQARHHSLIMTDLYTPKDIEAANEILRHHSSDF